MTDKNDPWTSIVGVKFETWDDIAKPPELLGVDLGVGERTVLTTFENDKIEHRVIDQQELKLSVLNNKPWLQSDVEVKQLKTQGSNLVDNREYLYYQCETCEAILDPQTKSFKTLDEKRFAAGWQVKWNMNGLGYKVYCEKCKQETT